MHPVVRHISDAVVKPELFSPQDVKLMEGYTSVVSIKWRNLLLVCNNYN